MKNKALERLISGLPLTLILFAFSLRSFGSANNIDTVAAPAFKLKTVIIDPGHGHHKDGTYSGASGAYSQESNVTLAVGFKLRDSIQKSLPELNVVMTRVTAEDVSLQQRAVTANENKGNLFISLHCNSLPDKVSISHGRRLRVQDHSGKGILILVYIYRRVGEQEAAIRENEMDDKNDKDAAELDPKDPVSIIQLNAFKDKYRKQSLRFANLVNDEFVNTDGRRSEGVREQSVHVLARSGMPSVLIEMGYINNAEEETYMNSEAGQAEIAGSILRALKSYKKEVEQVNEQ